MARLDAAFERLLQEPDGELVFEAGTGAWLRTPSGQQPVFRQALTASQIIGAFTEVASDDVRDGFPQEGTTRFLYASRSGTVKVRFDKRGDGVFAVVTAAKEEELDPLSGDLPAFPSRFGPGAQSAKPARAPEPTPSQESTLPLQSVPELTQAPRIQQPRPVVELRSFSRGEPRAAMDALLELMVELRASDLHLSSDNAPYFRVDGTIMPLPDSEPIQPERLTDLLFSIAPQRNRDEWQAIKDTDFAHESPQARFRVNLFADRHGIGAVIRQIPNKILTAEEMGLSQHMLDLCFLTKGLVLVTGPTGSGKSTTLAAMIDYVNRKRQDHIITIEDPIEFVHPNKRCLVNQREVGVNTSSFKHALRAALREDPDIVLVGELRDLETVAIAIETAETGHLVFGTLHTTTAPSTIDRIIDQFPPDRQSQIRLMLSESLKGVISQTLCKKIGGGRVAAQEVLLCNSAVANLIREGKTYQIPSIMQTNRSKGMVTLNEALFDLVKRKLVEPKEAWTKAVAKSEFEGMLNRGGFTLEQREE